MLNIHLEKESEARDRLLKKMSAGAALNSFCIGTLKQRLFAFNLSEYGKRKFML